MTKKALWMGVLMGLFAATSAMAGDLSAQDIIRRTHQAFFSPGKDMKTRAFMRLVNKEGQERRRELTMLRFNVGSGEQQKYYMYFHQPSDVRGTAFLVWKYPDRDDDRWLYIPAIHLVSRIAAKDRHSSFVGSDFTYEEISGRDLSADTHNLLREETLGGKDCYVVESVPKEESAYVKKISWISKAAFLPLKEEYYDVQGELFKIFTADEVQDIQGIPTILRRTMKNVKNGHFTEVVFKDPSYDIGLSENVFTERYLRRPPQQWVQ
jgi:hypothetical protein